MSSSDARPETAPTRLVRCAIISTDGAFRKIVEQAVRHPDAGCTLEIEFGVPFAAFGNAELKALKGASPEVVIVDLGDDPALGIKLAHFLAGASSPSYRIVASGPTLEAELLLELMRGGITEFLPKPVTPEQVREAVHRIKPSTLSAGGGATTLGEIYAFFGSKGGSGATTLATNLAIVLHRLTEKKTLLVDLDVELGEASLLLGIQPRFNFVDLIQNFHRVDAGLLASYIERHDSGVHLLSAPFHPDRAQVVTADQIRRILQYLKQHYDYIVIDVSKSFTPVTIAAFEQADRIFLTTTVDLPSLRNVQRALPLLQRVAHGDKERIRLLLNRFEKGGEVTTREVERSLGLPVYATLSNDYEAVIRSLNTGKPVVLNGTSAYSQDLNKLGTLITGVRMQRTPSGAFQRLTSGLARVVPGRRRESKSPKERPDE
ncbi:MAG: AAA family ATPase [Gemmatimonadales bacterium]|nr:AAA family ATPase [Gemmatimonadales bacterium]